MRIRSTAAAAVGALAMLSFLTPAAHPDTQKGDTVFTSLSFSKQTVNAGVSAAQTLTVTAVAKDGSGIKDIYGAKLVSPDSRIIHAGSADCTRPTSTSRKCVCNSPWTPTAPTTTTSRTARPEAGEQRDARTVRLAEGVRPIAAHSRDPRHGGRSPHLCLLVPGERNGPQPPTGKRCAGDRSPDLHAACAVRYAGYILA